MPLAGAAHNLVNAPAGEAREAGQLPSFDALYDEYADFVWRNARRLGIPPAALDDVVQDVFLVAHRKLGELTQLEVLRAWMFGIMIRVVRAHRRTTRRKSPHLRQDATSIDPELLPDNGNNSPMVAAERTDAVAMLHRVLAELDDAKREVFVLAELEELTEAQIAEILEENANTVHSRLRAAHKEFDRAVQRCRSRDEWRLR
jgi:RNA polymerase sigma-70 factor, ECF subfamily